ncbi:MAG: hypothetical protein K8I04_02905 [Gammaproteobacteria bacterium]|nr:hypothetical protein [Gammaproteobacteria bacterium]
MNRQDAKNAKKDGVNRQGAKTPRMIKLFASVESRTGSQDRWLLRPEPAQNLTQVFSWRLGALAVKKDFLGDLGVLAVRLIGPGGSPHLS